MRRLGSIVLVLIVLIVQLPNTHARQSDDLKTEMIAALNAWRLEQGLWPFKPNAQLDALAMQQASYLSTLPSLPDDIHAGPSGDYPKDRARSAGWPIYGRAEQIDEEEVAYAGHNVDAAITWWKGSTIHRNTIQNPSYREVGVAIVPNEFGHLFIVTVGGEPNILPALVDAQAGLIYLSNEKFAGAALGDTWIYSADKVRVFDSEGRPLDRNWQDWALTLPLPDNAGEHFFVAYTDGKQMTLSEVNTTTDAVLLPGSISTASLAPTLTPTPAPSATPTRAPSAIPSPTKAVAQATPVANAGGAVTATPPPSTTPKPSATTAAKPAITLIYDAHSLAIVNTSGKALDLTPLVLVQGDHRVPATTWNTPWLSGSLSAFPAGDCLQEWSWSEPSTLNPPSACRIQRGVINVAPDRLFWTSGDFDVEWNGAVLQTCAGGTGQCAITLP